MKKYLRLICIGVICMLLADGYCEAFAGSLPATDVTADSETQTKKEDEAADSTEDIEKEEQEINILFIGNSFTRRSGKKYDVGGILKKIAARDGRKVSVTTLANNGSYLSYYAYPSEKYGTYYQKTMLELSNDKWDYIVLQDYTKAGIECAETEMFPSIRSLYNHIVTCQTNAKILLYETSGYEDGSSTKVNGECEVLSEEDMQQKVAASYARIASELGIEVVHVGTQFLHCEQVYGTLYNLRDVDEKHPSEAGYYLAAACFYNKIFGKLPVDEEEWADTELKAADRENLNAIVEDAMTISDSRKTLREGESTVLTAAVEKDILSKKIIFWKSMDDSIATVDSKGQVTGIEEGITEIMAYTSSGLEAFCTVKVVEDSAASLSFHRNYYQVAQNDRFYIEPDMQGYIPGKNLSWSSSNTGVAKICSDGMILAVKPGKTTITVKNQKNTSQKATYTLYVQCRTPKNVTAQVDTVGEKRVHVSWKSVEGATSYLVYRATSKTGNYIRIATVTDTDYMDTSVKTNTTYYYKVLASAGYTYTRSVLSSSYGMEFIPGAPENCTAAKKSGYIRLGWEKNTKVTGYYIYRSTAKTKGYKKIATVTSCKKNYYYDKSARKGKTYYYKIKAYRTISGKKYESTFSKRVSAKR